MQICIHNYRKPTNLHLLQQKLSENSQHFSKSKINSSNCQGLCSRDMRARTGPGTAQAVCVRAHVTHTYGNQDLCGQALSFGQDALGWAKAHPDALRRQWTKHGAPHQIFWATTPQHCTSVFTTFYAYLCPFSAHGEACSCPWLRGSRSVVTTPRTRCALVHAPCGLPCAFQNCAGCELYPTVDSFCAPAPTTAQGSNGRRPIPLAQARHNVLPGTLSARVYVWCTD